MAESSEKQVTKVYVDSAMRLQRSDLYGSRAADLVLQQLEGDAVAEHKFIERGALPHIAAMKKDVATVREPDETVALPDEQRDDSPDARCAATVRRPAGWNVASRRRLSDSAWGVLAHFLTSAVPTVGDATGRRRRNHRRGQSSDGLH